MRGFLKTAPVLGLAFALSACVFAVGGDGWDDDHDHHRYRHGTSLKIEIDDDRRVEFACPSGYEVFTRSDDDGAEEYGCRRSDDD